MEQAVEQAVGGVEAEVGEEAEEVAARPWCGGNKTEIRVIS